MSYRQNQLSIYPNGQQRGAIDGLKVLMPASMGATYTDIIVHAVQLAHEYLNGSIVFVSEAKEREFSANGNGLAYLKQIHSKGVANVTNTIQDKQERKNTVMENVDGGQHRIY